MHDSDAETVAASLAEWLTDLGAQPAIEQSNRDGGAPVAGSDGRSLLWSVARQAMACEFEVLLNQHQYRVGPDRAVAALDIVESIESLLSVYRPQSDLSKLNQFGSQRPVLISYDTCAVIRLAQAIHGWTAGAFDLTAGTLSEVWGFSRRQGRMPSKDEIEQALQEVGSNWIEVDVANSTARLNRERVKLNPGGIGKGYALDRAAQQLAAGGVGDFMLHGGLSSVIARGHRNHPRTGGGWLVALKHPWRWEETIGTIRLRDKALGTSGSGKQFFHFGGKRYSHIIDPRTGWPADCAMSATVICRSAAIADALATAFFVMGVEAVQRFCDAHKDISAILVHQDQATTKPMLTTFNVTPDEWESAGVLSEV